MNIWRAITQAGTALIRTALPCRCALCGHLSPNIVCDKCEQAQEAIHRVRCVCCALPLVSIVWPAGDVGLRCGCCIASPPAFDATLALADYAAPLDTLALALKFNARLAIANYFAQRLALLTRNAETFSIIDHIGYIGSFDFIVPVPLSARRLSKRGYNQAWEIARPLAHKLVIPAYPTLMTRVLDTPPQTQLDDAHARQRNMRRAFAISTDVALTLKSKHQGMHANCANSSSTNSHGVNYLAGCHIAVIDDVMTSGATLEAMARTLKRGGATRITNLVALRTPKK